MWGKARAGAPAERRKGVRYERRGRILRAAWNMPRLSAGVVALPTRPAVRSLRYDGEGWACCSADWVRGAEVHGRGADMTTGAWSQVVGLVLLGLACCGWRWRWPIVWRLALWSGRIARHRRKARRAAALYRGMAGSSCSGSYGAPWGGGVQ